MVNQCGPMSIAAWLAEIAGCLTTRCLPRQQARGALEVHQDPGKYIRDGRSSTDPASSARYSELVLAGPLPVQNTGQAARGRWADRPQACPPSDAAKPRWGYNTSGGVHKWFRLR